MKISFYSSAVSQEADELASAWLAFAATRSNENLDRFAVLLDPFIHQKLPARAFRGFLHGCEKDVRQDAGILLAQRFLLGNSELIEATQRIDLREIANQLSRSISSAILISIRRLRRRLEMDAQRFREIGDQDVGMCLHSAQREFWALPLHLQRELALRALHIAVARKLLTSENADVAATLITGTATQAGLAKKMGISRQAVHQRLQPVRRHLWQIIETLEFPIDESG